jgi:protein SCO1/2
VIGGMLRVLVITLVLLVAALMLLRPRVEVPGVTVATVLDAPRSLPDVALVDQNGRPFSLASQTGHATLLFFGYTNCPDICPLTLAVLKQAAAQLRASDPATAPAVVFISIDPARDTPERIGAYLRGFDPSFIGATADEATLAPLLSALAVSVHHESEGGASYNVTHNGTIYVLDADGRWTAIFGGSSHQSDEIVHDYPAITARAAAG